MIRIWSYLLVALCGALTSAGVMDFPGNRNGFQGDLISGVKEEKVLTPPSQNGLIIDSNGFPGNSNEPKIRKTKAAHCKELCIRKQDGDSCDCDWPPFLNDIIASLSIQNKASKYQIIPFSKEDILKLQNSDLCKTMCEYGIKKPPCQCE